MSRRRRPTDEELERDFAARQLQLVGFSEQTCLVCAGPARQFSSTDVPEILGYVGGNVSAARLARATRAAGLEGACFTSLAGVSVCSSGKVSS